jgi:hypothetical protein
VPPIALPVISVISLPDSAGMSYLPRRRLAQLVGTERHDRQSLTFERRKFDLVSFCAVYEHNRANITSAQPVLGQVNF